ncbi:hypothetical protein CC1G_06471 [Coprinopsis cinerea okayama7|uniref:Uncharacterized protein n=1 Tax=Coprinopsis cinerea (strain Okayama-7 / 130 / ATCC MYA-4618 / FGSC 9003) TaxID=240176 RepID=A8NN81_COPC7|nr:hypothetical protein CC1G_06471 [Coprinopsis cinerea okayama7\|eukprot:XP_001835068.2 hypothetical protein CC1G_06471 [Coprinopsis cinerea okayama7\
MIQCLACEDWFHESCCNLRERPSSREPTPVAEAPPNQEGELSATAEGDDADADSEASFGLPPPLVSASDYESFICGACVRKIPILVKYAGTPGAIMVVRDTTDSPWVRIGDHVQGGREEAVVVDDVGPSNAGHKRRLSPSDATAGTREPKRTKVPSTPDSTESNPCIAPQPNPLASTIYEQDLTSSDGGKLGTGDIFLTDGFRERWCRCDNCRISLENHRYLVEEEETYEPPEDPDSGLSLEELGMRALARLPRDRALDGIQAFNKMRDGLKSFLQPFAEEGKVVNEADVRDFFTSFMEAAKQGSQGSQSYSYQYDVSGLIRFGPSQRFDSLADLRERALQSGEVKLNLDYPILNSVTPPTPRKIIRRTFSSIHWIRDLCRLMLSLASSTCCPLPR